MAELEALFTRYDQLVVFDTETTGLYPNRDEIIEFSAAVLERKDGRAEVTREYDNLVALSPGRFVPPKIQALTGITNQDLRERGIPKTRLCRDVAELISGDRTLLLAYNAHFDLSFLFYALRRDGDPAVLKGKDKLDLLTVYRDRRAYPPPAGFRHRGLRPSGPGARIPTGQSTTCWPRWRCCRPCGRSGTTCSGTSICLDITPGMVWRANPFPRWYTAPRVMSRDGRCMNG
ncbi:MAG: PolC-type DNA polymerase III [Oscillospiraceae bacterium]